ncbi:MAG: reverse transcriptase domain-containing protein [Candidatus Kerfeldbacteria bacterium]|nr:reverse transcriptase domain-containing protein [Candidatus Kerfeldbacteria bacterium]
MKIQFNDSFEEIISVENLLEAWTEFIKGKHAKQDVLDFETHLIDEVQILHAELLHKTYRHSAYIPFNISDPKPRNIHKASVRDRLLHHALHRKLYSFFDRTFIFDSFSCREGKGTHKALDRFAEFGRKVSRNNTRTCWILKCDIRKFFANIDHAILLSILDMYVLDKNILWLFRVIIESFETRPGVGLPLGNLTSQLFVNVYMNEFDQYMKHALKAQQYIRYADDFVVLSEDKVWLESILPQMQRFLKDQLHLQLHPQKVSIATLASGVDFLGWVHFPKHRVLRTVTKKRMLRRITQHPTQATFQSYYGMLQHGNAEKIIKEVRNAEWIML